MSVKKSSKTLAPVYVLRNENNFAIIVVCRKSAFFWDSKREQYKDLQSSNLIVRDTQGQWSAVFDGKDNRMRTREFPTVEQAVSFLGQGV